MTKKAFIASDQAATGNGAPNCGGILDVGNAPPNGTLTPEDYRSVAQAVALGNTQALVKEVWGCGDTAQWGRIGSVSSSSIYLWDSALTATRLDLLGTYTLDAGGYGPTAHYCGSVGNKALFYSRDFVTQVKFQLFDTATGAWEAEILGPAATHMIDDSHSPRQLVSPDGTIWVCVRPAAGGVTNLYSFNGAAWSDHGTLPGSWAAAYWTLYASASDAVYIVYQSSADATKAHVYEWDGAAFVRRHTVDQVDAGDGIARAGGVRVFSDRSLAYWASGIGRKLGLIDLTGIDTDLGESIIPAGGASNPANMYGRIAGSKKEDFWVLMSGAWWHVRYDPAEFATYGPWGSLAGSRTNGQGAGAYSGATDTKWPTTPQSYFDSTYCLLWAPIDNSIIQAPSNLDFATLGIGVGIPERWTTSQSYGNTDAAELLATFMGSVNIIDGFEVGWSGNQDAKSFFDPVDLIQALFQTGGSTWDGFEAGWSNVESALAAFTGADIISASSGMPEDFEDSWSNVENRTVGYVAVPGGGAATRLLGTHDTTIPEGFEDFEEEWGNVEDRATGYVTGPGGGLATSIVATFNAAAQNYESFEVAQSLWNSSLPGF